MTQRLTRLKHLLEEHFLIESDEYWNDIYHIVKSIEEKQDLTFDELFYLVSDIVIGIHEMEEDFVCLMLLRDIFN